MYYNENTKIFLDGNLRKASEASTDLYTQTMHYGSGVFEVIRSYANANGAQVFKTSEHYQRLLYSAEKMHIKLDYKVEHLL